MSTTSIVPGSQLSKHSIKIPQSCAQKAQTCNYDPLNCLVHVQTMSHVPHVYLRRGQRRELHREINPLYVVPLY